MPQRLVRESGGGGSSRQNRIEDRSRDRRVRDGLLQLGQSLRQIQQQQGAPATQARSTPQSAPTFGLNAPSLQEQARQRLQERLNQGGIGSPSGFDNRGSIFELYASGNFTDPDTIPFPENEDTATRPDVIPQPNNYAFPLYRADSGLELIDLNSRGGIADGPTQRLYNSVLGTTGNHEQAQRIVFGANTNDDDDDNPLGGGLPGGGAFGFGMTITPTGMVVISQATDPEPVAPFPGGLTLNNGQLAFNGQIQDPDSNRNGDAAIIVASELNLNIDPSPPRNTDDEELEEFLQELLEEVDAGDVLFAAGVAGALWIAPKLVIGTTVGGGVLNAAINVVKQGLTNDGGFGAIDFGEVLDSFVSGAKAGAEFGTFVAFGAQTATAIKAAGLTGALAFAAGLVADAAVGVPYDIIVHEDQFEEALLYNLAGGALGEVAGQFGPRVPLIIPNHLGYRLENWYAYLFRTNNVDFSQYPDEIQDGLKLLRGTDSGINPVVREGRVRASGTDSVFYTYRRGDAQINILVVSDDLMEMAAKQSYGRRGLNSETELNTLVNILPSPKSAEVAVTFQHELVHVLSDEMTRGEAEIIAWEITFEYIKASDLWDQMSDGFRIAFRDYWKSGTSQHLLEGILEIEKLPLTDPMARGGLFDG